MSVLSRHRLFALGLGAIAAMTVSGASAQVCDDRYPWNCRGFVRPYYQPGHPYRPSAPIPLTPDIEPADRPERPERATFTMDPAAARHYAALYAPVGGERFAVPAIRLSEINPQYLRRTVAYATQEKPGTIVIDPQNRYLYLVESGGQAIRYGVGVGRQGFGWSGTATVRSKQEWPDWYPPKEMIQRQPEIRRQVSQLRGGLGVPGGLRNPLGSRAMYLWQGDRDTLYRIHGTIEPWTIGTSVSSGCIRMINQDVIDLYQRTPVGAKVVVLRTR